MKKKISDLTKILNNLSVKSKNQSQIEEQKEKAGWCGSMKRKIEDTLGKKTTDGMVTETVQGVEETIEELITKFKVVKEEARKKGRETEKQRKETVQYIDQMEEERRQIAKLERKVTQLEENNRDIMEVNKNLEKEVEKGEEEKNQKNMGEESEKKEMRNDSLRK